MSTIAGTGHVQKSHRISHMVLKIPIWVQGKTYLSPERDTVDRFPTLKDCTREHATPSKRCNMVLGTTCALSQGCLLVCEQHGSKDSYIISIRAQHKWSRHIVCDPLTIYSCPGK